MTLWNLSELAIAEIQGFHADLPEAYQLRLRELGFEISEKIQCLKRVPFGGPRVFQIGDSVFSLAEEVASSVLVNEVS